MEQYWLGASADDAPEVLVAGWLRAGECVPVSPGGWLVRPRRTLSTMKPLPPHVVRALQEQQQ